MTNNDCIGVLEVLRDQIQSGFLNIAPQPETDEPLREQWERMFVQSLTRAIDALSDTPHQML